VRRVSRAPRAQALAVVVAVAITGLTLSACGNPETNVDGCSGTAPEVVAAISEKLHSDVGKLRNAHQFSKGTGGITFITAELHNPDKGQEHDQRHDKGDLLTWSTTDIKNNQFESVDEHARVESSWPGAPFDVRHDGAYESRACANISRGKTKAQLKCEQDQLGDGNSPGLPGNKNCEDL
jgi:hypothetical protein